MTSKGEVHFQRSDHPDSDDEHDHEELNRKDTASGWESSDNEHDDSFMKSIISNTESFSADKINVKRSFTLDIANDEEFKRSLANMYLNSYVATNPDEAKHCSESILACAACCQKADFYVDHEMVRFVPCAVEIDVSKAFGVSRRTLYAFLSSTNDTDKQYVLRSYKEWDHALPLIRRPSNGTSDERTSDIEDRRLRLNHSYASLYYNSSDSEVTNKLDKFLSFTDHIAKLLTKSISGGVDAKKHRSSVPPFTKENHCLVKTGNALYSHQYMGINQDELIFVMNNTRNYEKLRIPLTSILECHNVENSKQEFHLPDMYTLVVSTFSKKYEILLRTRDVRDSWCHLLSAQVTVNQHGGGLYAGIAFGAGSASSSSSSSPNKKGNRNSANLRRSSTEGEIRPFVDTISKTKGWKGLSDRPALNSRSFTRFKYKHLFPGLNMRVGQAREDGRICNGNSGRCSSCMEESSGSVGIGYLGNGLENLVLENPANIVVQDLLDCLHLPCLFVCKLLDLVLKLTKLMNMGVEEFGRNSISEDAFIVSSQDIHLTPEVHQLWIDFLDGAALLQTIDLTHVSMTREDTYCMYLNLYHVMMLHGYFVLGRPSTFLQWTSFFHKCTYEAFGDVFSMIELEHCVIRKVMPEINVGPISKALVIPTAHYSFVNQYKDYRLIWALNCGTYGFIPYIPIFSPEKAVKQLSQVARKSLQLQMRINVPTNSVTLPLPCQWFIGYFALKPESEATVFSFEYDDTVSGNQILTTLLPDLGTDMKESLTALLKKKVPITIKYSPFEFKCQLLYKMTDDVEEGK